MARWRPFEASRLIVVFQGSRQKGANMTGCCVPCWELHQPMEIRVPSSTDSEIVSMNPDEIVRILQGVRHTHLRADLSERLPDIDRSLLVRLMFLTRWYCQNRQEASN